MVKRSSYSGQAVWGLTEFIIDSEDDVANLPSDKDSVAPGSTAMLLNDSGLTVYMLSNQYVWIKI